MTTRIIEKKVGTMSLGSASPAEGSKVSAEIDRIAVYPYVGKGARGTWIQFRSGMKRPVFMLSPNAAIEVVKGLLQNLPDVYLATDDELQAIFAQKIKAAEDDARAVVKCVTERRKDGEDKQEAFARQYGKEKADETL